MAFSGAWRNQRTTRVDGSSYTDPIPPLGRPEQSALHQEPGAPPREPPAHLGDVPGYLADDGTGYDPVTTAQAPGIVYDVEPTEDHQDGTGAGGGQSMEAARRQGHLARTQDRGATARQISEPKRARAHDEVRTTNMLVVEPISAGSRVAVLRGRNSLPENNPDGFRVGQRVQRWQERKIPMSKLRRHDLRPLHVMTAAAPNDSPAPVGIDQPTAGISLSPFSSNVYSRTRLSQSPLARRVPRPWDEDVVNDGSPAEDPPFNVWGL